MPNTPNLRAVMERFGLRITGIARRFHGADNILEASGTFADGTPFATITPPFRGDVERRTEALAGQLVAEHKLKTQIDHGTERLVLARQVANAWVAGRTARMGLAEKAARIVQQAHDVPKGLEARLDALAPRLDAVERQGNGAVDALEHHVKDAEAAVAMTESVVRQISNGPLGGSSD